MQEKHYAKFDVILHMDGEAIAYPATLVSEHGIWKLFTPEGKYNQVDLTGKIVDIEVQSLRLHGRLIREESGVGTYYNLKFFGVDNLNRAFLKERIEQHGIPSPWKRKFARLSTKTPISTIPVPFFALIKNQGQFIVANIINFTLGGLLIESMQTAGLQGIQIDSEIDFDLMVSDDSHLYGMKGKVVRINDEILSQNQTIRSYGVELLPMHGTNDVRYKNLIKDYCMAMQKAT